MELANDTPDGLWLSRCHTHLLTISSHHRKGSAGSSSSTSGNLNWILQDLLTWNIFKFQLKCDSETMRGDGWRRLIELAVKTDFNRWMHSHSKRWILLLQLGFASIKKNYSRKIYSAVLQRRRIIVTANLWTAIRRRRCTHASSQPANQPANLSPS